MSVTDDVTIPRETALRLAKFLTHRAQSDWHYEVDNAVLAGWAELLNPQPPSLREQVARAWCSEYYGHESGSAKDPAPDQLDAADAVLTVVADWLAAQPLWNPSSGRGWLEPAATATQRDRCVRLLRGES